jgi:hypothetical protein
MNPVVGIPTDLIHCAWGLAGELGELSDAMKRKAFYGKEMDKTNVKEELVRFVGRTLTSGVSRD